MENKKTDMLKYLKDFLSEAEDHIQNLNNYFLRLEVDPTDLESINQLFRSSHTLKSSSAAMGFNNFSSLAHKMEDVLGKLREKKIAVNKMIIDTLLKCVDALEVMLATIKTDKKEKTGDNALTILLEALDSIMKMKLGEKIEKVETGLKIAEKPELIKSVSSIKVDIEKLDKLMELVGELIINKMGLENIINSKVQQEKSDTISEIKSSVSHLGNVISEIQYEVMQVRMVPVSQIFNRFPRMVRDLATKEKKEINFEINDSDIELDRTILDKLGEPLVHLLRNSIDHGIESEEERHKQGKKEKGSIKLNARKEKSSVIIEVEDDGEGFDVERIKQVALEKKIVSEKELVRMSDEEIMMLPFNPNFSTAKKVTEISGRGVGLDVVKTKIEEMNGRINLISEKNKGTKISLTLPLTLAIIQCFLIKVDNDIYGIPLSNIVRTAKIYEKDIKTIEGHETFILDEEDIPLLRMHDIFKLDKEKEESLTVVIAEKGADKAGLAVDKIMGQQELIIKPLEKSLKKTKGFSGSTILGDGSVALILDVNSLI